MHAKIPSILSVFLILALPASTNYSLRGFSVGSGGTDDSSSTNYRLNANTGQVSGTTLSGTTYDLGPGLQYVQQANVPPAPTLNNPSNYYDKLDLTIAIGGNPSDALFAVAISTDAFASETNYVQSDNTIGSTLGIEDYQTYASWGGASGVTITGLSPSTTYTVKVRAMHGDFTETDWGPTDNAVTSAPLLSFDIDVSSSDTDTSPPFAIDLGNLAAGTVVDSTERIWVDFSTNANNGGRVYVVASNAGLESSATAYTISSVTGDLAALSEGIGLQGASATQGSGGPFSVSTLYDVASDNVGIADTTIREIFQSSAAITSARGSFIVKAKSSAVTPAASDYAETLTVIASANF